MLTREEAIEKVKKLLRLATSSNKHEAALAAQRAQEILDRYELHTTMLDEDEPEAIYFTGDKDNECLEQFGVRIPTWKSYLSTVVAQANGCRTFIRGEWRFPHKHELAVLHIVGRKSDVAKVRYLYGWVSSEIASLVDRHGKRHGKTWRNNFRIGVVDAIKEKIKESQQNAVTLLKTKYQNNPLALVRLDQAVCKLGERLANVDDWIRSNLEVDSKKAPTFTADQCAREFGRKCGRELRFDQSARKCLPQATV